MPDLDLYLFQVFLLLAVSYWRYLFFSRVQTLMNSCNALPGEITMNTNHRLNKAFLFGNVETAAVNITVLWLKYSKFSAFRFMLEVITLMCGLILLCSCLLVYPGSTSPSWLPFRFSLSARSIFLCI